MSLDVDNLKNKEFTQANDFVESPYAQEFTQTEIKILEIAAASCKQEDIKFFENRNNKSFRFTTKSLAKLLNTSVSSLSHEAERLSLSIIKKFIHGKRNLQDGKIEFETIAIIPYTKYENGIFEFELNYKLIPYFVKIKGPYTRYYLKYFGLLKSAYAIKLYKLLYQYLKIGNRKFVIEDLKKQFGIKNDKYKNYGDFKRRVIDLSIKQINEYTDIFVTYNEIKEGNRVVELRFYFNKSEKLCDVELNNDKSDILGIDNSNDALLEPIFSKYKISHKISSETKLELKKYIGEKGMTYVIGSIEYALSNSKRNFDKYLKDTLINEWGIVKVQELQFIENKQNIINQQEIKNKEQEAKQREERRRLIKEEFNILPSTEKTNIFAELLEKLTKKHQDKLPELLTDQDEYIISYWACKNNLQYDGMKQLQLRTVWKVIK